MFGRSSSIPQRNKFCLTNQQIIDDIEAVYRNEEERNKLYYCLDENPPKEHRFDKIEEYLKGTQELERGSNLLEGLKTELENVQKEIVSKVTMLREVTGNK